MTALLFFLYGLAAGFLLIRLRRRRARLHPPGRLVWAAAWFTMILSFALAALLGMTLIWRMLDRL